MVGTYSYPVHGRGEALTRQLLLSRHLSLAVPGVTGRSEEMNLFPISFSEELSYTKLEHSSAARRGLTREFLGSGPAANETDGFGSTPV